MVRMKGDKWEKRETTSISFCLSVSLSPPPSPSFSLGWFLGGVGGEGRRGVQCYGVSVCRGVVPWEVEREREDERGR